MTTPLDGGGLLKATANGCWGVAGGSGRSSATPVLSVRVPQALQPYLGGLDVIKPVA